MDTNPYQPPGAASEQNPAERESESTLNKPVLAYTANGNLEAHSVVTWLESNGVRAHAVEDNSGVSLFAFGTISQFHKPQVFVDEPDLNRAGDLLVQFEFQRDQRRKDLEDAPPITAECEECGASSDFPASQNGTTQNCPQCRAFMDVGSYDWPEDFDFGPSDSDDEPFDNVDDAMAAALKLDQAGDWDAALAAYRAIAESWPEQQSYITNCMAEVQRKMDAAE